MDADWSVEMGHGDPVLEFPWSSDSPGVKFYDLKRHPELLSSVPEAVEHEPIGHFLAAVNDANSIFQTAKCDVWEETDRPSGRFRFCSYVDVLFANRDRQLSFEAHEKLGRDLVAIVDPVDLNDCSAEFIVRRCFYHFEGESDSHPGLCVTCYVKGFGSASLDARARWAEALAVVCKALLSEAN
ncbi:MAG TPA: hypothetical protein VD837_17890 [Terriglobales bacterium]|nr:hypothetical protein [Terriglobales bacterium]